MPNKTHLTRQEETINEVGVQLRSSDPVSPTDNQVWLNLSENKLKSHIDGQVRVYFENYTTISQEIPVSGTLDANACYNFYKEIVEEDTFTIDNLLDGVSVKLLLTNNQTDSNRQVDVFLPSALVMTDGNYWIIRSASNSESYHVWYDFDGTGLSEPVVVDSNPVRVIVTQGRKERTDILFKTVTTGQTYFTFADGSGNSYYVWYNVDGLNVNPIGGPGGIQVNLTSGATASSVALATQTAINFVGVDVTATISGGTLTIEANDFGVSADIVVTGTNVIQSATKVVDGASTTDENQVATLTAAALGLTGAFTTSVTTNTVRITYLQPGKSDDVLNESIPSGFSFVNIAEGSGPINVNFTNLISFANYNEAGIVPSSSFRFYEIIKIGPTIIGTYTDFDI
jgi:hypothetical protein